VLGARSKLIKSSDGREICRRIEVFRTSPSSQEPSPMRQKPISKLRRTPCAKGANYKLMYCSKMSLLDHLVGLDE